MRLSSGTRQGGSAGSGHDAERGAWEELGSQFMEEELGGETDAGFDSAGDGSAYREQQHYRHEAWDRDPDEFLAELVGRRNGSGAAGMEDWIATWGDGDRDDLDLGFLAQLQRDGMDMEAERVLAVLPYTTRTSPVLHGPDPAPGAGILSQMAWPAMMEEALALCASLGRWEVVDAIALKQRHGGRKSGQNWGQGRNRAAWLRPGQIAEIQAAARAEDCDCVFLNTTLTPMQARNLTEQLGLPVLDRFALILAIFEANATTKEARLQVGLASAMYDRTRLIRSSQGVYGDNKEIVSARARGGQGSGIGGGGEMQLELERRLLNRQIDKLKRELVKVQRHRATQRAARTKAGRRGPPVVALVGYTNAGKSALLNGLTGAAIASQDRLFCTLDSTMRATRRLERLNSHVILADTVGFISDLPTQLVAAFRSTLEEILHADVLLHVRDVSSPNFAQQKDVVIRVLREIGVSEATLSDRTVEIWSKVDLLPRPVLLEKMSAHADCAAAAVADSAVVPATVLEPASSGRGVRRRTSKRGGAGEVRPPSLVVPCAVVPVSSTERTGFDRVLREVEGLCST